MQFYCVKTKSRVEVEDAKCTKTKHALPGGRVSYMVRATDADGNKMTKFLSEKDWKALKCKEA
jgi:hypothetical protein